MSIATMSVAEAAEQCAGHLLLLCRVCWHRLGNLKDVFQSVALCLCRVENLPCVENLECATRSSVTRSVASPYAFNDLAP